MESSAQKVWSIEAQHERRRRFYAVYREHMNGLVDESGGWHGTERPQGYREMLWHSFAYLAGEKADDRYANRLLQNLQIDRCHFAPFNCMQILNKFPQLAEATAKRLLDYVERSIPDQLNERIQFAMYNPNFASMATAFLILAGEWLDDARCLERGSYLLDDLRRVLTRCGTIMEYGAPTYTPITTMVMAEIVNYSRNEALRELAAQCEHRMWAEIASHFHLNSGQFAGPYSRAYWIDSVGHCTALHGFLHYALGDAIVINPLRDSFSPRPNQVGHHGNSTLMWPNHLWLTGADVHCPDELAELILEPAETMESIYVGECIPCRTEGMTVLPDGSEPRPYCNPWEYGAFSGPNYSYLTRDFSLGTACSQFHDGGLSESFFLTYALSDRVSRLEESRVAFLRYIINDREPERENLYSVYGPADPTGFRDEARKFGIQHRDCSMMVYKPKQFEARAISSMKLSLMIPCHFAEPSEITVGDTQLEPLTGATDGPVFRTDAVSPVFLRDGSVVVAFVPLLTTNHGGGGTSVERRGNYVYLSFVNYDGLTRRFVDEELQLTSAGCVIHVKSVREGWGVDRLRQYVASFSLTDRMREQLGGTIRWIRYGNDELELEFAYSPISEGIMVANVNGKPRRDPVFYCSAIQEASVPFLS